MSCLVLCFGAVLTSWALWDAWHPHVPSGYAHYFIARDADCMNSEPLSVEVMHLPWKLDLERMSRRPPGMHCLVGWNDVERDRIWSSRPNASLLLRLAPNLRPSRLIATMNGFRAGRASAGTVIRLDGRPVPEVRSPDGTVQVDTLLPLSGPAAATSSPDATMVLVFHADHVGSPRDLGISADPRRLGVSLERLELR